MSQASPSAVSVLPRRAYRIVLFGMPQAGKSSLLGALAQAAQTQENQLNAKLTDKAHGLTELQRRLYEDRPRETLEEVVPFVITLEPFTPEAPATEAILFDCDGRIANELLARKDALSGDLAKRALAQAILNADALLLTVDVSAEPAELKMAFAQFTRFLRTLERSRGQRTEIGGLPVYLVLTKCDLLAEATDSAAQWMDRIEERKREVYQRFQEFLAQQAAREQMAFGTIDLLVWATAVKRPALTDAPARPREPYGVAELFRQCLDSARAFRERRRQAGHRLLWVAGILAVAVSFMVLLALFFLSTRQESELVRFERDLQAFRASHSDGTAERLQEPLDKSIRDLKAFKDNPLFAKMPTDQQQYVDDLLKEAVAYTQYTKAVNDYLRQQDLPRWPRKARSLAVLDRMEAVPALLPVPPEYQKAWEGASALRWFRDWPEETQVMRREVARALAQIKELRDGAAKLKDENWVASKRQREDLRDLLKTKEKDFKYRVGNFQNVPDSQVTYNDVAEFDTVHDQWQLWLRDRADPQVKLDAIK
jgi:GTPase SAR1 family protein